MTEERHSVDASCSSTNDKLLEDLVHSWKLSEREAFWVSNLVHYNIYRMRLSKAGLDMPEASRELMDATEAYWSQYE
jgi:hypothetical protein